MLRMKWLLLIPFLVVFAQDAENWIEKEFIGVGMDPSGMFSIGIPNEESPLDPIQILAGNYRFGGGASKVNFRVDGINYTNDAGAASDPSLDLTDLTLGYQTFGGKSFDGSTFRANWDIDGLLVTQQLTPLSDPTDSIGSVIISYIFYNPTMAPKEVGMLTVLDTRIHTADDVPVCLPSAECYSDSSKLFWGDEVPGFWSCQRTVFGDTITAICDIGSPVYPQPDWMMLTDDREALRVEWDWEDVFISGREIDGTAVIMAWDERMVGPGESFVVSYTYGTTKGGSTGGAIDVSLIKPNWLNVISCELRPNPWPLRFSATNAVPYRMFDLAVDIEISSGLEFVEGEMHYDLADTFTPGQVVNDAWIIEALERPEDDTPYPYTLHYTAIMESIWVDTLAGDADTNLVPIENFIEETLWVEGSEYTPPEHELILPLLGEYSSDPLQQILVYLTDSDAGVAENTVKFAFLSFSFDTAYPSFEDSTLWFDSDTLHVIHPEGDSLSDGDVIMFELNAVADNDGCLNTDTLFSYFNIDMTGPILGDYWPVDTIVNDSLILPWLYTYDRWCRVRASTAVITIEDDMGIWEYNGEEHPDMMDYRLPDSTLFVSRPGIGEWLPDGLVRLTLEDLADDVDYGPLNHAPACPYPVAPDTLWSFTVNAHGPRVYDKIPMEGWYTSNPEQPITFYLYDGNGIEESTVEFTIFGETVLWDDLTHESDSMHTYEYPSPFENGDVVDITCNAAEDTLGTTLDMLSNTSYSFTVDLESPYAVSVDPADSSSFGILDFTIDIELADDLAGLNYGNASVTVDGEEYSIEHSSLYWSSASILTWVSDSVAESWTATEGEPFEVCFHVEDSVHLGENNAAELCFEYVYDPSGPVVEFIGDEEILCGGSTPIYIYVFDSDGIIPSSIECIIANDTFTTVSPELTFTHDTLITITPGTPYIDGDTVEVCVTRITDAYANSAEGLPICEYFIIDAVPPVLTYEVALDNKALWHIYDMGGVIDTSSIHVNFDGTTDYYWGESFIYFEADTIIVFDYDATGLDLVFEEAYNISLDFETKCGDLVESDNSIIYGIDEYGRLTPSDITLHQNRPNPFNSFTEITFEIPVDGMAVPSIHDLYGRQVRTLYAASTSSGMTSVIWDGKDDKGFDVSSGYYLYRLATEQGATSKGMFLLK